MELFRIKHYVPYVCNTFSLVVDDIQPDLSLGVAMRFKVIMSYIYRQRVLLGRQF